MNILSLFNSFANHFSHILGNNNPRIYELESLINNSTNNLNISILKSIIEGLDLDYKKSKERKGKYYVKETRKRTLITSLGIITFDKTYYVSKKPDSNGNYSYYSFIEDCLGLDKWAKMTDKAEVNLVNNSLKFGITEAGRNTIPNCVISRQAISSKIKKLQYNYTGYIIKSPHTPKTIFIEADEVHVNLQRSPNNKNKIVPVILIHEGYKEDFVKRKELNNKHYLASSILKIDKLWEEAYKYLDQRYDLDKIENIFISGDGAAWIKQYDISFPNSIFVLDKFHYRKSMNYIFKRNKIKIDIADHYLRNNMIAEFNQLINTQSDLFPHQKEKIKTQGKYLINNIHGIINQKHDLYTCPCSMEGHISNVYARHMTSRPHAYSLDGLENIVQLLTMKANNIELTEELYIQFKKGESTYKKLNLEKYINNYKKQSKIISNKISVFDTIHTVNNSSFSIFDNYRLDFYLNKRK